MLTPLDARETETSIELTTRTAIEVHTASHRAVRGYTLAAAICDDRFLHSDGARPDAEIIAALKPALASFGGKLIALSSPYTRRGQLWETYKRHFGQNDASVMVAQAPSTTMDPTLAQSVVDLAMSEDPARARDRIDLAVKIWRIACFAITASASAQTDIAQGTTRLIERQSQAMLADEGALPGGFQFRTLLPKTLSQGEQIHDREIL